MAFDFCCKNPRKYGYILTHDRDFDSETQGTLLNALWRLPEIGSYQAEHKTIFSSDTYDDFFIELLKTQLDLHPEDLDIIVGGKSPTIDDSVAQYYEEEICLNCSKLVFHKNNKITAIVEFFNHLRNMIAHGCFNIVGGTFIGFDHPRYGGIKYTAVFKAPYNSLKNTILFFAGINELYDIYARCLEKLGYHITRINSDSLIAEKASHKYMLIIKHYSGRYASKSDIENFAKEYEHIDKSNCMFVLIIDSTYATKDIQSYLIDQNIMVVDKNSIKKMMSGEDILSQFNEI